MPMFKKSMIAVLLIAGAALLGTIYGQLTKDDIKVLDAATTPASEDNSSESKGNSIFVYVTGAVNKPGMIELVGDSNLLRVADAVNACGGLLPTADVDNFNMAQTISDGQHIRVPEKIVEQSVDIQDETTLIKSKSSKPSIGGNIVDINRANADELDTLPGIGPAMAQRIIDYRQEHGEFKSIEEIKNVRGIGEKKFEDLKNRIKI